MTPPTPVIDEEDDPTTEVTSPFSPTAAAPLRIADRYAVVREIARGGMARVLLAEHVDLHRQVALKVMTPPRAGEDLDFEARFRTEARTLGALDHPNIITIHDFGVLPNGRCFLAMEYVEGPRLADVLRQGPFPVDEALRLAVQVVGALRFAHDRGVVHRDLSPSNVLLTTDADGAHQVKIIDFGIAKVDVADAEETQEGVILGSPHCMAPEQIDGVGIGPRTDVYAVGVLLFRMLTGRYPFRGDHAMAVMMAHLEEPVPRFADVRPDLDLPAEVETIVHRCLAKEADARWPSMAALLDEILTVAEIPTGTWAGAPVRSGSQAVVEDAQRFSTPMLLAALLAVIGLASLGSTFGVLALNGWNTREEPAPVTAVVAPIPPSPDEVVPDPAPAPSGEAETPPPEAPPAAPVRAEPTRTAPEPVETPRRDASPPRAVETRSAPQTRRDPEPAPPAKPARTSPSGYKGLPDDF